MKHGKFEQPRGGSRTAAPKKKSKKKKSAIGPILVVVLLIVLTVGAAGLWFWGSSLQDTDTIFPHVYLAGVDVGGMTADDALTAVDAAITQTYAAETLEVNLPDRKLTFDPTQTNVALDSEQAVAKAMEYGRDCNPFSAVLAYHSSGDRVDIDLTTTMNLDTAYIRGLIDAVAADMNGDGMITVGDVVSVLRLVLGGDMAKASARSASRGEIVAPELDACEFSTIGEGRVVLPVALNNTGEYSAFQLDVVLPEGVELMEATFTDRARASHNMMWNTMADGRVRIVAYAMNNATFRGNEGVLLNLVFDTSNMQSGEDAIILSDALFAMANSAEHRAADLNVMMRSETTEINALQGGIRISGAEGAIVVETATAGEVSIYSLTGQMVQNISVSEGTNRIALPAGMYMVNRQKIIVK